MDAGIDSLLPFKKAGSQLLARAIVKGFQPSVSLVTPFLGGAHLVMAGGRGMKAGAISPPLRWAALTHNSQVRTAL